MSGGAPGPIRAAGFPFSAVVGQDEVKLALLLAAVDPAIGGVLLRGEKGSAKTTLARGLAALLPGGAPFVELPVGATEDRLVGTLDLVAALTGGARRFEPGLLAAAHGGVLYVDEVNLLPDHLVDVLLDVAASGVNRVEREGVSHAHPSRFVLIGSMNPEEGDLRPQLLDRFGLAVDVVAPVAPALRADAVRRRLAFDAGPAGFACRWADEEAALAERLAGAVGAVVPDPLLVTVSQLCAGVGVQGLRADLTICRAAAALAGFEGRVEAGEADVRRVAMLALAHRRRTGPFDAPGMSQDELDEALERSGCDAGRHGDSPPADDSPLADHEDRRDQDRRDREDRRDHEDGRDREDRRDHEDRRDREDRRDHEDRHGGAEEKVVAPGLPSPVVRLVAPRTVAVAPAAGRRSTVEGPRGRMVADRAPDGPVKSLAVGATVAAAAVRRSAAAPSAPSVAAAHALVTAEDLREAVRQQRAGNLIVLAVDASGSMGAEHRMEAAKGAVLGLLLDAYQRRDKVAMVTFGGDGARVVLKPTSSVEVARARLTDLPTGGRTPLAAGIRAALDVAAAGPTAHRPLLVLITDGRATSLGADGQDPWAAACDAGAVVRRRGVGAVVVDAEDSPTRLGLARELAGTMGARYLTLPELSAAALVSR